MEHHAIVDELIALLHRALGDTREIESSTALIADIGMESIQIIEYLCEVEDRFDLVIDEVTLADVHTVGDLADVVLKLSEG